MAMKLRLELRKHAVPLICGINCAFSLYDRDWNAALGWFAATCATAASAHKALAPNPISTPPAGEMAVTNGDTERTHHWPDK